MAWNTFGATQSLWNLFEKVNKLEKNHVFLMPIVQKNPDRGRKTRNLLHI